MLAAKRATRAESGDPGRGARGPASATPVSYETDGMTSRIAIDVMGDLVVVKLDAVGEHWAANAALALLAADLAQRDLIAERFRIGLAGRAEVVAAFAAQSRYFNTFGGNTVSIAAASG